LSNNNEEATGFVNFDKEINTLDIIWNTRSDKFQYLIDLKIHSSIKKSYSIDIISRIFDPLGLVGPELSNPNFYFKIFGD